VAANDRGGDKSAWIVDLLDFLKSTNIEGFIWFEADKIGEPDWRLTGSPQNGAAARKALSDW
jgi:hypothetical protein